MPQLTLEKPSAQQRPITVLPPERIQRLERRITLVVTILPFLGFLIAVPLLWGKGITGVDAALFGFFYILSGLGVTIGFHRLLTHRAFESPTGVKVGLAIAGSLALQGPVIRWVADHRRHHAFTDKPGDPHSPHLEEAEGWRGILSGLWHAHIGWLFDRESTTVPRFAPDLLKEPRLRKVDKLFPLWAVISLVAPALAGLALTGTFKGAGSAFIWGGLVRIFFLHHITWSINSICHFYGKRPFANSDFSTNNWALSLISFGEGWHNNHHAFPSSARHGLERGQIDPTAAVIWLMERLGLARDVKVPTRKQIEQKQVSGRV